ncbi:MAG: Gfo/Idh/MocA family protein [Promethearchaeota archaeon]
MTEKNIEKRDGVDNNRENGKKIKVGFASFAHMHAYSYYNALKLMPEVEITAIAEENKESQKNIKKMFKTYYDNYEALVKGTNVDVVIVTTENVNHKRVAIMAMENGKDVIVEKPIATTLKDADEMIRTAEKTGQKLIQCYPCRYHPTAQAIKSKIDSGELGKILSISATNHGRMPAHEGADMWFSVKELSGGGALMDHITHVADLNFWFSGQNLKSVFALKRNYFHPDIDIDDAGIVYVDYTGNMKATIDPSWSRPKNFETWGDLNMLIYGTEAVVELKMFSQNARLQSNNLTHAELINYGSNMDYLMLKDFITHIRNDEMPMLSGVDGKNALEVAILAYKSAESGKIEYK